MCPTRGCQGTWHVAARACAPSSPLTAGSLGQMVVTASAFLVTARKADIAYLKLAADKA